MASLLQETEAAVIDASAEQGVEAEGVDAVSRAKGDHSFIPNHYA